MVFTGCDLNMATMMYGTTNTYALLLSVLACSCTKVIKTKETSVGLAYACFLGMTELDGWSATVVLVQQLAQIAFVFIARIW